MNDLPCALSFETTLFADNTCTYLIKILTVTTNVQNELDEVDTWVRSHRLSVNYSKTAYDINYNPFFKL